LATSHYCRGKWRSGPVSSCSHHARLAKKQINVYKGVGDPGGRSDASGGGSGSGGASGSGGDSKATGGGSVSKPSKSKASGSSASKSSGD
jgi:hypothetical protein